ncbi:MAG: flagellar basal body-associated FliL family protein [Bdellovibrionales bacterium]|nr:flagellar basal body-associated FliL family protein [Bdellovibrionales bacterium]
MTAEHPNSGPSSDDGVFSLEDLDKIIEAEDPTFKEQMESIQTTGFDVQGSIESIDVDGSDADAPEPTEDENRELTRAEKIREFFLKKKSLFQNIIRNKYLSIRGWLASCGKKIIQYARHELPDRLKYYKSKLLTQYQSVSKWIREEFGRFKALSRVEKSALFFVILATIFSLFFLTKVYTGNWLPKFSDIMIHSLEDEASLVATYKDQSELQNLFQAFPEAQIFVLLTKVTVNLRPDSNSSSNPMGIYEVYLGVDSKDTAVEVKAREDEIRDNIQRVLEPFTYTEVSTNVGKVRMKSAMRDQINTLLNQGQVIQVYFNTFISKP